MVGSEEEGGEGRPPLYTRINGHQSRGSKRVCGHMQDTALGPRSAPLSMTAMSSSTSFRDRLFSDLLREAASDDSVRYRAFYDLPLTSG